ncbi:secreted RxLR effector protein 161-like [Mercurialis annua]|uniref:secreted RxLR effector protein 161-like n=1 Tax=Mercurialis annua TaxID=3986 RepID=UPI00215EDAB3|nr:secreted RxLR effector protein 161-like [Mercurialis annua]
MSYTRPDIAYSVNKLSSYTSNPGIDHWKAITRILRYLRNTREFGLHYTKYPAVLEGFSDANWISDIKDSKCTKQCLENPKTNRNYQIHNHVNEEILGFEERQTEACFLSLKDLSPNC